MSGKTGVCSVCGDKAVGYNFNGYSCESCKIFFRRHATKLDSFKCNSGTDNCKIDMYSRNGCRRCRLKKCYQIGMKKELIDYKYTKRSSSSHSSKARKEDKENSTTTTTTASSALEKYSNPRIATETGLHINDIYFPPFEMEKLVEIKEAMAVAFVNEAKLPVVKVATFVDILNMSSHHVRRIIKFCKAISAFRELSPADQLVVLKGFHCEIGAIRGAFVFNPDMDGTPVVEDEEAITAVFISLRVFKGKTDAYRNFMNALQSALENDSVIRDLLIAQRLFLPRENIAMQEFIRYNHQIYLHLLRLYLEQKYDSIEKARAKIESFTGLMQQLDLMIDIKRQMIGELNFDELNQEVIELFDLV